MYTLLSITRTKNDFPQEQQSNTQEEVQPASSRQVEESSNEFSCRLLSGPVSAEATFNNAAQSLRRPTQVRTKCVKLWTNVCTNPRDFTQPQQPRQIQFKVDSCLHENKWPPRIQDESKAALMGFGVTVDFKVHTTYEEVERHLRGRLDLDFLEPDSVLVDFLDMQRSCYKALGQNSATRGLLVADLFDTNLFKALPEDEQIEFKQRVHGMVETETFYRSRKAYRFRQAKASLKTKLKLQQQQRHLVNSGAQTVPKQNQVPLKKDPTIHTAVETSLKQIGLSCATVGKITQKLNEDPLLVRKPGREVVKHILKNQFGLSYLKTLGKDYQFQNTRFDPKRLWASRLQAQALKDNVLVLSIDESSFNWRNSRAGKQWQPSSWVRKFFSKVSKERFDLHKEVLKANPFNNPEPSDYNDSEEVGPDLRLSPVIEGLENLFLDQDQQSSGSKQSERESSLNSVQNCETKAQVAAMEKLDCQARMLVEHAIRRHTTKPYSKTLSLLAAMSQEKVVAIQLIEGGVCKSLFENFLYQTLLKLRGLKLNQNRQILVLMDNAQIHRHDSISNLCHKMRCSLCYQPQYSPWLQPVECLFNHLKRRIFESHSNAKIDELPFIIQTLVHELNTSKRVPMIWQQTLKALRMTIHAGHFHL